MSGNWESTGLGSAFSLGASLQYPSRPNLSRTLVAGYLGSMMWCVSQRRAGIDWIRVWRACLAILLFHSYVKLIDRVSPLFPLITYPMDVIAAVQHQSAECLTSLGSGRDVHLCVLHHYLDDCDWVRSNVCCEVLLVCGRRLFVSNFTVCRFGELSDLMYAPDNSCS